MAVGNVTGPKGRRWKCQSTHADRRGCWFFSATKSRKVELRPKWSHGNSLHIKRDFGVFSPPRAVCSVLKRLKMSTRTFSHLADALARLETKIIWSARRYNYLQLREQDVTLATPLHWDWQVQRSRLLYWDWLALKPCPYYCHHHSEVTFVIEWQVNR